MPVLPSMPSLAFSSRVIRAVRPGLDSAKDRAASTLGSMEPGGKLPLGDILPGHGGGQVVQTLLVGLAEVDGHLLHGGEDDEHIGVQQFRQLGGGEILVDDGGRSYQTAVAAHHGDTAAAYGDDHGAAVHQRPDGILLDDIHGLGGGDHLTPATTGVLHHGAATLGHDAVGGHLVIEGADGLGGVLEGRVVFIHQGLGHHGGHALADAPGGQLVADGVLPI